MPLNIEPLDRNQRTAFQEREALREKVNEIIETVGPMEIAWDAVPTEGHGAGYAVTSEGVKSYSDQGDAALGTRIDSEASQRSAADTALGTRIDDEETYRTAGDATLGEQITAEQTARADADTALGTRISEEQTTRQTADTNIRAQIANEQTARADADTALGTRIDGKQDVLVSGTNIKTVGGNSILGAGDIPISGGVQWDPVPTAGHGTGYAVTSEGVKNALDTETGARSNADTALGTRIDGKQDTLVSGTNIKTINGNSVLGSGNIEIGGDVRERIMKTGIAIIQANLSGIYSDQMLTFNGTYSIAGGETGQISFIGYRIQDYAASIWSFIGSGSYLWTQSTTTYQKPIYGVRMDSTNGNLTVLTHEGTATVFGILTGDVVYEGVSS